MATGGGLISTLVMGGGLICTMVMGICTMVHWRHDRWSTYMYHGAMMSGGLTCHGVMLGGGLICAMVMGGGLTCTMVP